MADASRAHANRRLVRWIIGFVSPQAPRVCCVGASLGCRSRLSLRGSWHSPHRGVQGPRRRTALQADGQRATLLQPPARHFEKEIEYGGGVRRAYGYCNETTEAADGDEIISASRIEVVTLRYVPVGDTRPRAVAGTRKEARPGSHRGV